MDDLSKISEDSARSGFFLFSGAALASVIMAVSAILLGRFLGPELYGQYNLILVIPTLLLLFTDLGINAGVTKFVAGLIEKGQEDNVPPIIRQGMIFRLAVGILLSALTIVFANYFSLLINRPGFDFYIQLATVSVIFQVIFTTANSAFVGFERSEYSALASTVQAIVKTLMQVPLVLIGFSVGGALIGYVGGFVVAGVFGAVILLYKFMKPYQGKAVTAKSENKRQVLGLLVKYGMPVYVSVVLIGFFPLYQQVILAFFSSDSAIGNYRAAFNFVTLFTVISTSITTALLPAFSKLETANSKLLSTFFNRANKYTCLLMIPLTVVVILFSGPIIQLIYGTEYTSAALFLSLSCSVYLLSIVGFLTLISVFNGIGKTRLTMNMTLINFILILVLSPILAPLYDVVGVIAAFLIGSLVSSVYAAILAVKKLGVKFDLNPTLRICIISALSSIGPLILLLYASLSSFIFFILGSIMFLFTYISLVPIAKIINREEINSLKKITQKIPILKWIAKPIIKYAEKVLSFSVTHKDSQ